MKKFFIFFLLALCLGLNLQAKISITSGKKYFITCEFTLGYVGLGEANKSSVEILYVATKAAPTTSTVGKDGWWIISGDEKSGYTIQNESTGKYLSYTTTRTQYVKYLTQVDKVTTDQQRFQFIESNGALVVQNMGSTVNQYFNLRQDGTYLLGGFTTYGEESLHDHFQIYDQSGKTVLTEETSGNTDEYKTTGYNTTEKWAGTDEVHTFRGWTSNNKGVQSSSSTYTVTFESKLGATIAFDWSVSCENYYDFFSATLDGETIISSESGIVSDSYSAMLNKAGTHTLVFTYSKDYMEDGNKDQASVSNLILYNKEPSILTINCIDSKTSQLLQSVSQPFNGTYLLSELPSVSGYVVDYATVSLPYQVTSTQAITVYYTKDEVTTDLKYTQITNGQFAANTTWYRMRVRSNKYAYTSNNQVLCTSAPQYDAAFFWCFVDGGNGTFTVYNYATGASMKMSVESAANGNAVVMSDNTKFNSTWEKTKNGTGLNWKYPNVDSYCNDFGSSNVIKLWENSLGATDGGSRFEFEEIGSIQFTPITSITLTPTLRLYESEETDLEYSYLPADATLNTINFTSSNPSIATVDNNGHVKALSGGRTTITATFANDASISASCAVSVVAYQRVTDIQISQTGLLMPVGASWQLSSTIQPNNARFTDLKYSTSDKLVANIDETGNITATGVGSALITVAASDDSGVKATCKVVVTDQGGTDTPTDRIYVFQANGRMEAFPTAYISERNDGADGSLRLQMIDGTVFAYKGYEIDSICTEFRAPLPEMTSFKFNNKFNDQLTKDIEAPLATRIVNGAEEFYLPQDIDLTITGAIGKWLTPSFKLSSDDCAVYLNGVVQQSKKTRQRMSGLVTYTVAPRMFTIFCSKTASNIVDTSDPDNPHILGSYTSDGKSAYGMMPFGRDYRVNIKWATDLTTAPYRVPTIYINTDDETEITSKDYYWNAHIYVDGAGVYDDYASADAPMPMRIRGRGNTSWGNGSTKKPYRIKFDTKQKLFGLTKGKNWVLLANNQKGSMTTNALAMKMADMVETAACNHIIPCELYINGKYRGSYNFTEKVGFSNNSVDLVDETNAVLLQLDTYSDNYQFQDWTYYVTTTVMNPQFEDELEAGVSKEEIDSKYQAVQQHWNNFTQTLRYGYDSNYQTKDYADMLDADYLARAWFVNDFARNGEYKHPKSWFVYNENAILGNGDGTWSINKSDAPYIFGPVWDFDWSYGYDGTGTYYVYGAETELLSDYASHNYGGRFFEDLTNNSNRVKKAYYSIWHRFMEKGRLQELLDYADDYYAYVSASYDHNATKENVTNSPDYTNYAAQTEQAKEWLQKRANFIYSTLTPYDLSDEAEIAMGDVNEDGVIDAADLVCLINYIMGIENESFEFSQADTDHNNLVTMKDAANVMDLVMAQTPKTVRRMRLKEADASMALTPTIVGESSKVSIPLTLNISQESEQAFCAMQFDVKLPEGYRLDDILLPATLQDFSLQLGEQNNGEQRVVLYASAHNTFPAGKNEMQLVISTDHDTAPSAVLALNEAVLVSSEAEDYRLNAASTRIIGNDATGIRIINNMKNRTGKVVGDTNIFDLSGRRVNSKNATKGIYIMNGNKIVK
ncbi:MAG: Ig-like domain-containing protein [Bacteroidales bacterium]|nr:Ig-like domain-containing protein [Candidatus Physcousia equi]